jgi:hypothetical protein
MCPLNRFGYFDPQGSAFGGHRIGNEKDFIGKTELAGYNPLTRPAPLFRLDLTRGGAVSPPMVDPFPIAYLTATRRAARAPLVTRPSAPTRGEFSTSVFRAFPH